MNSFVLCKVKFDEINLYIIIGVEFLFLCVFIVMMFYFYFNRIMDIDIDWIESKVSNFGVIEEGVYYLNLLEF